MMFPTRKLIGMNARLRGQIQLDSELAGARYFTRDEIENGKIWPAARQVFEERVSSSSI